MAFGHYHNQGHNTTSYSPLETEFKELLDNLLTEPYLHEHQVKTKIYGRIHCYYLDFYFPLKRVCIEINPAFHKTYVPVATRDKIRTKQLKKHGIKVYTIPDNKRRKLNRSIAIRAIKLLNKLQISKGALPYYSYAECITNKKQGV